MSEPVEFIDFPYFSVKFVHPNVKEFSQILYPTVLERFFDRLEFGDQVLPPRFGACRRWAHPNNLITLRYGGAIRSEYIAHVLTSYAWLRSLKQRRDRRRLSYRTLCNDPLCRHPLHVICNEDPTTEHIPRPRHRRPGTRNNEWLTMPEESWLFYQMRMSVEDKLADVLVRIASRIDMSYLELLDIWETKVRTDRRAWFETFVVEGEHQR